MAASRLATDAQLRQHSTSLARAAALILIVFATGIGGFTVIGGEEHGIVDAIFMTAITLTTVGYGETIDVSSSPQAAIFTTVLLFAGVGSFVYFFSNLTAFMVEGSLDRILWRRKMRRAIDNLDGHYIVCGGGATGAHIVHELLQTDRPFVLIDHDEARTRELFQRFAVEFPVVVGDATDDDTLTRARIEHAKGLTSCISSDKDNLIVTVSARLLNPDLRIVSRCIDEKVTRKVRRAGAAAVVSPNMIGGMRMVSEMIRPTVVSFLDIMLRDNKRLRVEEFSIEENSKLAGMSVGNLKAMKIPDVLVVALSEADGSWIYNPEDDERLSPGRRLIFMGSPSAREAVERFGAG